MCIFWCLIKMNVRCKHFVQDYPQSFIFDHSYCKINNNDMKIKIMYIPNILYQACYWLIMEIDRVDHRRRGEQNKCFVFPEDYQVRFCLFKKRRSSCRSIKHSWTFYFFYSRLSNSLWKSSMHPGSVTKFCCFLILNGFFFSFLRRILCKFRHWHFILLQLYTTIWRLFIGHLLKFKSNFKG